MWGLVGCTNAFAKSIEVGQPRIMDTIRKSLTVLKATTGEQFPSIKSPRKQILAFHRLMSPAGFLLRRNTHVAGMNFAYTWSAGTSSHTWWSSSSLISVSAAWIHLSLSLSFLAWWKVRKPGSVFWTPLIDAQSRDCQSAMQRAKYVPSKFHHKSI